MSPEVNMVTSTFPMQNFPTTSPADSSSESVHPEPRTSESPGNARRRIPASATADNSMSEFCEQTDPKLLRVLREKTYREDQRRTGGAAGEMRRVQQSWVAAAEKRALAWLAARTPETIDPDHLTALGLAAQLGAGACYALAAWNKFWLLGVVVCLALNWLGDSLDGTLARARQRLRPRYGFYVDHMVDSFGALALMGGLALSGYIHPWIATGLLVGFLMLSIQSYLATHTLGEFRLSFWRFGPTEIRILLAVGSLALLWKPRVHVPLLSLFGVSERYRLFDVGGTIAIAGMGVMVVAFTVQNTVRLYREERIAE
jgi:archaetidylinositol phosphate synthase